MLKEVFIFPSGLVAAFDYDGVQRAECQGSLVDFYYQMMKERGLANEATEFHFEYLDPSACTEGTGAALDLAWDRKENEEGAPG